jgi:hypothetical protein
MQNVEEKDIDKKQSLIDQFGALMKFDDTGGTKKYS